MKKINVRPRFVAIAYNLTQKLLQLFQTWSVVSCQNLRHTFKNKSKYTIKHPPSPTTLKLLIKELGHWKRANDKKYKYKTGVFNPHVKICCRCKNCNETINYEIHTVMPEPGYFKIIPKEEYAYIKEKYRKSEITIFCKNECL